MSEVAQRHQDKLPKLKEMVRESWEYFKDNYETFHEFRKFVFKSTITDADSAALDATNKPEIEFNIQYVYLAKLLGEFSKQEPSIICSSEPNRPVDPELLKIVEGYLKHVFDDANKRCNTGYNIYKDTLSGGFSSWVIRTDYVNDMSFEQGFILEKPEDPTLIGYDTMAMKPGKSDGDYCFRMHPTKKADFKREWPDVDIKQLSFTRELGGFSWSYKNQKDDVIQVCEFFLKKKRRIKIYQIANGDVMTMDEYEKFKEKWPKEHPMEQVPVIAQDTNGKMKERWTNRTIICRYIFIENQVLSYEETDYPSLPFKFNDGDSVFIRDTMSGFTYQMTTPYCYHAKGAQRLKNFAGQTLANELENMTQTKMAAAVESIPENAEDAYKNPQKSSVYLYNAYKDNDPNVPLPPPTPWIRVPTPPEVTNSFVMMDALTQNILGSFDADMAKVTESQSSGIALQEIATLSNASAMPYIVSFLQSMTEVAQFIVDMIPGYLKNHKQLPIINMDGTKSMVPVNQDGYFSLDYKPGSINVSVEAGVSFAVQKSRALQQLSTIGQAFPIMAQFIGAECGEEVLDNMELRGIDSMKQKFKPWLEQQKQQQAQAAQSAQQNNPVMLKLQQQQAELKLKEQQMQQEASVDMARVSIEKQNSDNERMKIMLEAKQQEFGNLVQLEKAQTEKTAHAIDYAIEELKHKHQVDKDVADHHHKVHETILNHMSKSENKSSEND